MKIGIFTEYFPRTYDLEVKGGAEASAFNEAHYLSKNHQITVITSNEKGCKKKDKINHIKVLRCGKSREYVQTGSFIDRTSYMKAAYDTGKKENFDIIVAYNFITYPIAWKLSRKLGIPCVARYHDVWIGEWVKNVGYKGIAGEILERYTLSRDFSRIIAVSNFTRKKLEKFVSTHKIDVVPNIVEVPPFKIEKFKEPTICCVSRLVEYKRVDDLIKAVSIVKNDIPNINCVIIGTGPREEYLKKMVKKFGLDQNIKFYGFVKSHLDVLKTIKSSHLFCLPSSVEGFGIVLVESMRLGVPFIASNIDPLIEASQKKGGIFFQLKNYKELAEKIKYLLDDHEKYHQLSREGVNFSTMYKGEKIALELEKIYNELIG
ncbi:MAG: glycosyltransferase family 4 protein [Methanobacteriaceae archaeon]